MKGLKISFIAYTIGIIFILFIMKSVADWVGDAFNNAKSSMANSAIGDVFEIMISVTNKTVVFLGELTGFNGWLILFLIFFLLGLSYKIKSKL